MCRIRCLVCGLPCVDIGWDYELETVFFGFGVSVSWVRSAVLAFASTLFNADMCSCRCMCAQHPLLCVISHGKYELLNAFKTSSNTSTTHNERTRTCSVNICYPFRIYFCWVHNFSLCILEQQSTRIAARYMCEHTITILHTCTGTCVASNEIQKSHDTKSTNTTLL